MQDDVLARLPEELRRRDARHPRLRPGETLTLDFHRVPHRGEVVLVLRDGAYALDVAPALGWTVAVLRVALGLLGVLVG